jgi:hypothetical protein
MPIFNAVVIANKVTFLKPPPPPYPVLEFVTTDPAHPGVVALGTSPPVPGAPPQTNSVWTFNSVVNDGYQGHKGYGEVNIMAPYGGTVVLQHGVQLSNANVTLSETVGGSYTLNGNSTVTSGSTLTAWGGRYASIGLGDTFHLNGSMYVNTHSVANFNNANLAGTGTFHIASGGTVDLRALAAGLHADVDKGGMLFLGGPNSAGTIIEAAGGAVFIKGATTATHEIFHEASGTLDLLNKSGVQVASLKFAPGSHEYTSVAPIHGGLLEITTNPMMAGNLHTTFTS